MLYELWSEPGSFDGGKVFCNRYSFINVGWKYYFFTELYCGGLDELNIFKMYPIINQAPIPAEICFIIE